MATRIPHWRPTAALVLVNCNVLLHADDGGVARANTNCARSDDIISVTGDHQIDTDTRRTRSVAKIVIGHDEIMTYGASNIGDVLKRLPGVTIFGGGGRTGGEIRMRGLGSGYAQILINGEPAQRDFVLDAISPE